MGETTQTKESADRNLAQRDWAGSHLLIALPALNEERTVGDVIRRIPKEIPGISTIEVVVVDDGSDDRTSQEAMRLDAHVIRHPSRQGVGAAFHTALAHGIECKADLIVTIDADGQFDPADIPKLILPVVSGAADFATASRFMDPALIPDMPWIKLWGNRMMSRLVSRLAEHKFYDVSCGMRCYGRKAALRLHLIGDFTYTQEVFLNLAFKRMHIAEIPIKVRGKREFGKSRVASNLFRYALRTSQIILRSYRDYHPLRFFGTAALLSFAVSAILGSFFLGHYFRTGAFSPHLWAGFVSATFLFLSLFAAHAGMIGDLLSRHRIYLEELLYHQRRSSGDAPAPAPGPGSAD